MKTYKGIFVDHPSSIGLYESPMPRMRTPMQILGEPGIGSRTFVHRGDMDHGYWIPESWVNQPELAEIRQAILDAGVYDLPHGISGDGKPIPTTVGMVERLIQKFRGFDTIVRANRGPNLYNKFVERLSMKLSDNGVAVNALADDELIDAEAESIVNRVEKMRMSIVSLKGQVAAKQKTIGEQGGKIGESIARLNKAMPHYEPIGLVGRVQLALARIKTLERELTNTTKLADVAVDYRSIDIRLKEVERLLRVETAPRTRG